MQSRDLLRLRLFLGFAALTWGISVYGVFASWTQAMDALGALGAKPVQYDPLLEYWLRMTAGAFTLVGCTYPYLLLMLAPVRHSSLLPWFGG